MPLAWLIRTAVGCALAWPGALESLPGYQRSRDVAEAQGKLQWNGRIREVRWSDTDLTFVRDGHRFRFDLEARQLQELPDEDASAGADRPRPRRPPRGRQRDREPSPDGRWVAVSRDWNVVLEPQGEGDAGSDPDGAADGESVAVTSGGRRKLRYGTASWVYGEELDQTSAMWWSPDSSRLAFYELDERNVADYPLALGLTDARSHVDLEGYPNAGDPNPIAGLLVYDVAGGTTTRVDVGSNPDQYVYGARFTPDGGQLLFLRTNRHQNVLELVAADPADGAAHVVLTETQRTWQDNRPELRFLADGRRFVWQSQKTGWPQYELRDLDGALVNPLTRGAYPAGSIEAVDETDGTMYYMAFSDSMPLSAQLHRVGLDGTGQRALTGGPLHHSVQMSPDCRWFVDTAEAVDVPPTTVLRDRDGELVATLAEPASLAEELGLQPPEMFTFKAADGVTDLYGVLHKPSSFDPTRAYPLLIDVYGGPQSQRVRNRYSPADSWCELGFLIAVMDNRGTGGRGKTFEDAVYLQCGTVDIADQAAGVRHLLQRDYVDPQRVGIYGHSYGGYMAAMGILRYPDLFQAAVAGSPVTDWRNYDSIYTERYMRTPAENPDGYRDGSCLTWAGQLQGHLLLMHGMADDNVHPNNAWQLVQALHEAGKSFETEFFPNATHGLPPASRAAQWAFLARWLAPQP